MSEELLNDDDLALYALGLLSIEERAAVTTKLYRDTECRNRLAAMRLTLGVFAEEAVPIVEVPAGSLDRLMKSIAGTDASVKGEPDVYRPTKSKEGLRPLALFGWLGWPLAGALALFVAVTTLPRQKSSERQIEALSGQLQRQSQEISRSDGEQRTLQERLQGQVSIANAAQAESVEAKQQADVLRIQAIRAFEAASRQGAKADLNANAATDAARERNALQSRVSEQASQTAQIAAESAEAQLIVNALKDPSALNVSLKVPKQKVTPSGRGIYVSNTGALIFIGSHLPQLSGNKVYELWLTTASGASPIAAGTFVPDGAGNAWVVTPKFRQNIVAKGFAITVENPGGSQTPTLPILLAGA